MKIAIGTQAPPKVNAIKEAVEKCVYLKWQKIDIISKKVDSGIWEMPISLEENILWAQNRAKNLIKEWVEADLYIWMEGWTTIIWENSYLFWAVYIIDKKWKWSLWLSPMMQLPDIFHERVYTHWEELGPVLSEITWVEWASKKTGSFGHWSDDMLTRKDQFFLAFTAAICPFYNKYYKL
jgi:inosine/xanthosine triphosphatase